MSGTAAASDGAPRLLLDGWPRYAVGAWSARRARWAAWALRLLHVVEQ